jgi:hypothetical protein
MIGVQVQFAAVLNSRFHILQLGCAGPSQIQAPCIALSPQSSPTDLRALIRMLKIRRDINFCASAFDIGKN